MDKLNAIRKGDSANIEHIINQTETQSKQRLEDTKSTQSKPFKKPNSTRTKPYSMKPKNIKDRLKRRDQKLIKKDEMIQELKRDVTEKDKEIKKMKKEIDSKTKF